MPSIIVRAQVAAAGATTDGANDNGQLTKLALSPLGRRPRACSETVPAWWLLRSTHDSVTGLFDTLHLVRRTRAAKKNQSTRGRLSSDEQDLLRAAVVFTSAGLDAALTALLREAVPILIAGNETAHGKFERFLDDQILAPKVSAEFRAAIKDPEPRSSMVRLYVDSLTKASFQGSGDVKDRAREALGLTNKQLPTKRITELDKFFTVRNDVAHRMDHLGAAADAKPARKQRHPTEVGAMCDQALLVVRDLIKAAAANIAKCPTMGE